MAGLTAASRSLCVGLTGGVAAGKSTVAEAFAALGVPWIDADHVARAVVAVGSPGLEQVIAQFGPKFRAADGGLDRRRMRQEVFADAAQRKVLEGILHPLIRADLRAWRDNLRGPYGLLMVPILIEGGFHTLCDRILVVDVPESVQLARLQARDGIDAELAAQMLAAQATRAQRLAHADDVLTNTGAPDELTAEVARLHQSYLALASDPLSSRPSLAG